MACLNLFGIAFSIWEDPMKKFMVLYMASGAEFEKMMKNSTPEQQRKGMDAWMDEVDECQ